MSFIDRFLNPPPPSTPNPLAAVDSALVARCSEARQRYKARVDEWRRAVGDNPDFTADPVECRYAAARACVRVCGVLAEPRWTKWDIYLLTDHLPAALTCPEFRALVEGYLTQILQATQVGRDELAAPRSQAIG